MRISSRLFAAAGAAALAPPGSAALTLVQDGEPRSVIVAASDASPFAQDAARDLRRFIQKSSGAELRIVEPDALGDVPKDFVTIHIGPGPVAESLGIRAADLLPEQYRVKTGGNRIVIVGHDITYAGTGLSVPNRSRATVWGVNYLLDRYVGVRWLWPGEVGTYVPRKRTITIPELDVTGRPKIEQRQLPMRWPARNPEAEAAVKGDAYKFLITPQEQSRLVGESLDWMERHQLGERFQYNPSHSFTHWWDKYGKTHPEYFAVPPPGSGFTQPYRQPDWVKLRIGNPAVAAQIVEEWKAAGSPDIWRVGPNDGPGFDTSAESLAWDIPQDQPLDDIWFGRANLTARYIRFWNNLLVEMRKTNPRVRLVSFAYSAYRTPPPPEVRMEPGMVLGFVETYEAYREWSAWRAAGAELTLRPNWWHVGVDAPHLPLRRQGNFFLFAHDNGMRAFRFDQLYGFWGTQGTNYYLIARLSSRPDLSVEQVLDEYVSAFGAAAPSIWKYLRYWEDYANAAAYPAVTGSPVPRDPHGKYDLLVAEHKIPHHPLQGSWFIMPYLYTDEVVAAGLKHLDEADRLAANEPEEVKARIRFLRDGIRSMVQTRDVMALAMDLQKNRTEEGLKRFEQESDKLRQIRRELTLRHVVHGDVQFRSEIRRGIPTTPDVRRIKEEMLQGL